MIKDHYSTLGVSKNASIDEIKRAYRKLASKHHPDRGGSKEEFQRIEEAYRILSDPQQRQQYDNPQPQFQHDFSGFNFGTQDDIMNELFGQFFRQQRSSGAQRTQQPTYRTVVFLTLEQIYSGQPQEIRMQTSSGMHNAKLDIPRGIGDGTQLRYDKLIPDGPLIVEFRSHPHLKFQRVGNDLHCNQKISILDLIVGTTIEWTGIDGKILMVKVPPKTQPNMTLKIAGAGMPIANTSYYGDAYLLLKPFVPDYIHDDIINAINTHKQ